ncbi:MAG: hypothetical protein QM820_21810 [Minicystis sp.]
MNLSSLKVVLLSIGLVALSGCSAKGGTGSGTSCQLSADCGAGEVCVTLGSESACTLNCSVSADACGGSGSCEGVGAVGVSVCQESKPAPSTDNPPDPKEQPKLACKTDKDCSAIKAGMVCGEWEGERDCTIPCTEDAQCNPPPIDGIGTKFASCQKDQGDASRTVCLPRKECFTNPTSCVTFPGGGFGGGPSGFGGGFGF